MEILAEYEGHMLYDRPRMGGSINPYGSYIPPDWRLNDVVVPPHIIIFSPVQTAFASLRGVGTGPVSGSRIQISVSGLYLEPLLILCQS